MNVGYSNTNNSSIEVEVCCPLCGADIYINKHGTDYKCMNRECVLFEYIASELVVKINSVQLK